MDKTKFVISEISYETDELRCAIILCSKKLYLLFFFFKLVSVEMHMLLVGDTKSLLLQGSMLAKEFKLDTRNA